MKVIKGNIIVINTLNKGKNQIIVHKNSYILSYFYVFLGLFSLFFTKL